MALQVGLRKVILHSSSHLREQKASLSSGFQIWTGNVVTCRKNIAGRSLQEHSYSIFFRNVSRGKDRAIACDCEENLQGLLEADLVR